MAGKAKDITGQKFGYLIALRPTDIRKWRSVVWEFLCTACGSKVFLPAGLVTRKRTPQKSCGCLNYNDLTGQKFGRLTALRPTEKRIGRSVVWECECSCPARTITYVTAGNLTAGSVKSCGCVGREKAKARMLSKNNPNPRDNNMSEHDRIVKRKYPEYKEWRTTVFVRDSFTCQKCGGVGGRLNAHHIESYASNKDKRTLVSNGITLCKNCHRNYHHVYGNDVTEETFNEWMEKE